MSKRRQEQSAIQAVLKETPESKKPLGHHYCNFKRISSYGFIRFLETIKKLEDNKSAVVLLDKKLLDITPEEVMEVVIEDLMLFGFTRDEVIGNFKSGGTMLWYEVDNLSSSVKELLK